MKRIRRGMALLLAAVLCLCTLSACGEDTPPPLETALEVGYTSFGGVFSPFYAELDGDKDVVGVTQLSLLSTDRNGKVILNGIRGETTVYSGKEYTYNGPANVMVISGEDGTVEYEFTLREDIRFEDGTPLTADDVIFTMYVLCDPMYDGPSGFSSLPIKGLTEYRRGLTPKWKLILKDTPKNAASGSKDGYYTSEEALGFWSTFNQVGTTFAQAIADWYISEEKAETVSGVAALLGYEGLPEEAMAVDLFNAIVDRHGYDVDKIEAEQVEVSFKELLLSSLSNTLRVGVVTGKSALEIDGIEKTGPYSLRVTLTRYDAAALSLFCLPIAPLHHYGDKALYQPQDGTFGFEKGNLTKIREKNGRPLGAGAYSFIAYGDGIVSFKANLKYYRGAPKTEMLYFKKVSEADKVDRLQNGTVDIASVSLSKGAVSAAEKVNGGVLNGDKIAVLAENNGGYGYIGLSADGVNVGGNPSSQESKYLRQALAIVIAYYRQVSLDSYYGNVPPIEYPVSPLSPVTPLPSDAWYNTAFSTDIHGEKIAVAPHDSAEKRLQTVLAAVLEYVKAAGYTVENGKVTEPVAFDVWYVGGGEANSPAYLTLAYARNALERIGITLKLREQQDDNNVANAVRLEKAKIWCAERRADGEDGLYAVYASVGGLAYQLDVDDPQLDALLKRARSEEDIVKRRALYAECFNVLEGWAVAVPFYQKKTAVLYRPQTVDGNSLAADTTGYYRWIREIENVQMIG